MIAFRYSVLSVHAYVSVLQIRRGKMDNLGIIFHITPLNCVVTHN